jgi:hypothetical protein
LIADLQGRGIHSVFLEGNNEFIDIFRLSCIEAGIKLDPEATAWVVSNAGSNYILQDIRDTTSGRWND